MATWVASGTPGTTSATLPAGTAVGDYVCVAAYRGGSAVIPTLPAGWTTATSIGNGTGILVAYREYDGVWTMPTFTNAQRCVSMTIRAAAGMDCKPGATATASGSSATVTFPAITPQVTDGTSVILRGCSHARPNNVLGTPTNHTLIDANGTQPGYGTYRKNSSTDGAVATVTAGRADTNTTFTVEVRDIPPASAGTFAATDGRDTLAATGQADPPPTVAQAGYRFYDQGTESGSVALGAENTPITGDLTAGDGIGSLRVLLQSTNATALPATDDWQLQWEKNANGTWTNVITPSGTASQLYPESNLAQGGTALYSTAIPGYGQSFLGDGKLLTRAGFYMHKNNEPSAGSVIRAYLYAHTGTFGTTGTGTGAVLATSLNTIAASTLSPTQATPGWVYFDFAPFALTNGVPYVIVVSTDNTTTGAVMVDMDTTSPTNAGTSSWVSGAGAWTLTATRDLIFEVDTASPTSVGPYDDPSLTNGQATTNRMTGTGTFSPGKVSETGLVSDLGIPGNNFTEVLYSVQISKASFANGDTIRFRVLRNGAAVDSITQTPLINVVLPAAPPNEGSATVSWSADVTAVGSNASLATDSTGDFAATDGIDTISSGATFGSTATLNQTDGRDTLTATPTFGPTAALAVSDGLDTFTAAPTFGPTATLAISDGRDTLTSTVTYTFLSTLVVTDGRDTFAATATYTFTSTLVATDGLDTVTADVGGTPAPVDATFAVTDGRDTFTAVPTFGPTGSISLTDGRDTLLASGAYAFVSTLNPTDGRDTLIAVATAGAPAAAQGFAVINHTWAVTAAGQVTPTVISSATSTTAGGQWVDVPIDALPVKAGETYQVIIHLPNGQYPVVGTMPLDAGNINGVISVYGYTTNSDLRATSTKTPGTGVTPVIGLLVAGSYTSTLSGADGRDTLTSGVTTTAPTFTATLVKTDGVDTLTSGVTATAPTFTATLIQSDGIDTIVASAQHTAPTFTGTISLTDGVDTLTAAPTFGPTAFLAVTDGADTIVASGQHTAPTFTGTLALTDGSDTLIAVGDHTAPTFTATLVRTDGIDTVIASAQATPPTHTGTLAISDGLDTLTVTATYAFVGALSQTDGSDTVVASAQATPPTHTATLVRTDGADILVASVDSTPPTHTGTLVQTDGLDTIVASAQATLPTFTGTIARPDGLDTILTTATASPVPDIGTLVVTDGRDIIFALVAAGAAGEALMSALDGTDTIIAIGQTIAPTFTGSFALTDGADTVIASAQATPPTHTATLVRTDGIDTMVATATTTIPTFTGTLARTDGVDTLVASGQHTAPTFTGTLTVSDGRDGLVAAGQHTAPTFTGALLTTDGPDAFLASTSTIPLNNVTLNVTDGWDTIAALAILYGGTFAATDGRDTLSSGVAAYPVSTGFIAITDGRDSLAAAPSFGPTASLTVTDGRDTLAPTIEYLPLSLGVFTVTDGTDTMVAEGVRTRPLSAAILAALDGRDLISITAEFTAPTYGYVEGLLNGQFFDAMQYGNRPVMDWIIVV